MGLDEIINRRISVRHFDASRKIPHETLTEILGGASLAPSWKNSQTARYYIAESAEAFEKIRQCLGARNAQNVAGASVLAVTSFEKNVAGFDRDGRPDNELGNGWGIYDSGIANAFLLLKAAELGVDSLVMGIRDSEAIRAVLDIPESQEILAVIALGYRAADPSRPLRKPLDEIIRMY